MPELDLFFFRDSKPKLQIMATITCYSQWNQVWDPIYALVE
jgi:hypothetical protein